LLYAYDSSSSAHERCRNWLTEAFNGGEQIGLPWQTLLTFVRIATNSRAFRVPLSGERACGIVSQWLTLRQVVVVAPGESFWQMRRRPDRLGDPITSVMPKGGRRQAKA